MVLFWFGLVKKRSSVNLCYHSPIAPKWLRWLLVNLATKSESGWWFGFVVSDSRHPWSVLLTVWSCWHAQSQQWRRNEPDGVSNHQPHDCLLNRLFRRRSKKTSSSASLAFVRRIHRWPVNSLHKGPVTRKMFPFDDVIMCSGENSYTCTVKPVYNDHLMWYFSAFWSSSRWPGATYMSSRWQKLLSRVNWYLQSSLKHITD